MQSDSVSTTQSNLPATQATATTSTIMSPLKSQDNLQNSVHFASLYSSTFSPRASLSLTPYSSPPPATIPSDQLYHSRLVMQHQDMVNRHTLCLTRLREAAEEAEILRQENATLRSVNHDLNKHLSLFIQSSVPKHCVSTDYSTTPFELVNGFHRLGIGGGVDDMREEMTREEMSDDESPTSMMESTGVERVALPKSISVRSSGYLKMMSQAGAIHGAGKTRCAARPRALPSLNGTQKVYVRGGKKEEEPLELEVYNQGMFKTELCNKWQETGTCPYGDHCQFAHGIEELRPVIRHPRYKTEVCRMVLAGDICPYGHRCHFRHALAEQERFMSHHLQPRAIKMDR